MRYAPDSDADFVLRRLRALQIAGYDEFSLPLVLGKPIMTQLRARAGLRILVADGLVERVSPGVYRRVGAAKVGT